MQENSNQVETGGWPRPPSDTTIYAVGDIHGRADVLKKTFALIDADFQFHRSRGQRAIEVFLGDYVDRGPASRETIDLLIGRQRARETVFLRGNHELVLQEILSGGLPPLNLRSFGLLQTLRSYGIRSSLNPDRQEEARLVAELKAAFPTEHHRFLERLQPSFTCGDFFFAHAGVRPGVPLEAQAESDLVWIRDEFLDFEGNFGKYVVHGHTPVQQPDIRPNRINIDTGAYATSKLTTIRIQDGSISILQPSG